MSRARARVTASAFQAPYSAKDSIAFQSATRSTATTDWVMVCSSTLRTSAVTHSTNRRCPGRVKADAKGLSSRCQRDQTRVACRMGHLLVRCLIGGLSTHQGPLRGCPAQEAGGVHRDRGRRRAGQGGGMTIAEKLRRLAAVLDELATIDLGYPQGENTISPPRPGAVAILAEAGLAGIGGLGELYSACDGISIPDVHNAYFIYDLDRVCSHLPVSDPVHLSHADGSETVVLTIGPDGGGNHFALDRGRGRILFLPIGPLHEGRHEDRRTTVRTVAEDISHFLDLIIH